MQLAAVPAQVEECDWMDLTDSVEDLVEVLTLKDWRVQLYGTYPSGETATIFVQRDDFATSILGVYKGSKLDLYKPPEVIFAGEAGNYRRRYYSKAKFKFYSFT